MMNFIKSAFNLVSYTNFFFNSYSTLDQRSIEGSPFAMRSDQYRALPSPNCMSTFRLTGVHIFWPNMAPP